MIEIKATLFTQIAPNLTGFKARRQRNIITSFASNAGEIMAAHGISTQRRVAHFIAQIAHESDGFSTTEEYASGKAYEGRQDLGNTQKGDGKRFKGRGLIQLTGRSNYKRYGTILGVDLIANPQRAAEPSLSFDIACTYWTERRINRYADNDDLIAITRAVNGGRNGLAERRSYLRKARTLLSEFAAEPVIAKNNASFRPVLYRGCTGAEVDYLQMLLRQEGFDIPIDGYFGPATQMALTLYQRDENLFPDGIAGAKTWHSIQNGV